MRHFCDVGVIPQGTDPFLASPANIWTVKEVFGRTPEAGKLRWVASQDLKVVIGKVLLVHPAFVAVDGLSVYGQIGAPLQGQIFSRSRGVRGYGRA